ncbi:hypothetical protein VNI00_016199 [Paramarasmius palmivorus]|uniref:Uncharacterized protein n=1 Tax=Paramarasmius palmivorus TaxID=297713 RepID=A0AAW0BEN2_9AGAR
MDKLSVMPYPFWEPFHDSVSPDGLALLKRVSPLTRHEVRLYESKTFCVSRLYGRFFSEPDIGQFRRVQARCGALVSGSVVVQFLSRKVFEPGDLDIFVPFLELVRLGQFLSSVGYVFQASASSSGKSGEGTFEDAVLDAIRAFGDEEGGVRGDYDDPAVVGVFNFVNEEQKRIQLVGTQRDAIEVVLRFYSSSSFVTGLSSLCADDSSQALTMNIVTSSQVISFYPRTSFVEDVAVYLKYPTDAVASGAAKYEERGWSSESMITAICALAVDGELALKTRWVGDSHCWVIDLEALDDLVSDVVAYPTLRVTSWSLECASQSSVRVSPNRMECPSLPDGIVVSWDAERELWSQECMLAIASHLADRHVSDSATLFERYPWEYVRSGGQDQETSSAREHFVFSAVDCWLRDSEEDAVGDQRDLEQHQAYVFRFLSALYPRMNDEFRLDSDLRAMHRAFVSAAEMYEGVASPSDLPSGHVVALLRRYVRYVRQTGYEDRILTELRFWFDWEYNKVWTTCTVRVSADQLVKVKEDMGQWRTREYTGARLKVELASY